jgi:hypothetical protein
VKVYPKRLMSITIPEIRADLRQRLEALEQDASQIRQALTFLDEQGDRDLRPTPGVSRTNGRRGAKRAPRGQNKAKILDAIGAFPGTDLDGIVVETHIAKPTVRAALHKMRQSGALTVDGGRYRLADDAGAVEVATA